MARTSINIFLINLLSWFFVASLFSNSVSASPEEDINILRNLLSTGDRFFQLGQQEKAMENYQQALNLSRKLRILEGFVISLNNIGFMYQVWGQYDKAIENYQQVLAIAKRLGKEDQIALSFLNIGQVYQSWRHYDKAIKKFQQDLTI